MHFEKENINSKDENSELMMDIMCGFAQEESRNMSENIQRAIKGALRMAKSKRS